MNRIRKFLKTGHIFRVCESGEETNYCNRSVPHWGLLVLPNRALAPYTQRWPRQMRLTTANGTVQQTLKQSSQQCYLPIFTNQETDCSSGKCLFLCVCVSICLSVCLSASLFPVLGFALFKFK